MTKIKKIIIAFLGIVTVVIFLLLVNIGVYLDVKDTLVYREVSFFISPYMKGTAVTVPLYQIYNIILFLFSLSLFVLLHNLYAKIGAVHIAISAIISMLLLFFPMDRPDMPQTMAGMAHNIVVLSISLFLVTGIFFFGMAFQRTDNLKWLAKYSYIISITLLAGSFITVIFAYSDRSLVGLIERLPLGAFLFWIILVAIGILLSDRRFTFHTPLLRTNKRRIISRRQK